MGENKIIHFYIYVDTPTFYNQFIDISVFAI